jgi:hypothetical protein
MPRCSLSCQGGDGGRPAIAAPPSSSGRWTLSSPRGLASSGATLGTPPPAIRFFAPTPAGSRGPRGGGSGASFVAVVVVVVVVASLEAAAAEASPSLEGAAATTTAEDRVPFHDTRHQVVSPLKERPAATTAFFKGGAEWSTQSFSERGDHLVDGEGRTGMVGLDGWLRFATAAAMLCCTLRCE